MTRTKRSTEELIAACNKAITLMKKGTDISVACDKADIYNTDLYRLRKKGLIKFAGVGKQPIKRAYKKRAKPITLIDNEENVDPIFFFRGSSRDLENLTKIGATHADN